MFTYSGKQTDVSNNGSTIDIRAGRFALNLRFVIEQLYRVLRPGCNACIHIQQLLSYKIQHGFAGRRDFRGAVVDLFRAVGFRFAAEAITPAVPLLSGDDLRDMLEMCEGDDALLNSMLLRALGVPMPSEAAIWKDPQQMAQRLNLHSLQFKTGWSRSSTSWAPAVNDYLLVFQKPGEVEHPVRPLVHAKNPDGWMSQEDWILWARGTWDIDPMDVIDGARSHGSLNKLREAENEKHVCALQKEFIRRCVLLYSNPADVQTDGLVLDPFMGVGSTAVVCVETGRNAVGFELKESYHRASQNHVEAARKGIRAQDRQPDLFSALEEDVA